ncbi:hypothetical protein A8F94_10690 [Bacillus sp. FJAT-27225]|uniref:nuclease-related domain-containing protein n=1 Tax=Bacillus sp. FJAT-27225 TaxID=1743144 RepID=UPI00080C2A24|nr:nuclease-related domain-containing protein [Bacillus sp. FJAT-27225]OCA88258.1 hypothetical protein A8F94_10690 [Bacillus sp. FJAT-27225]
MNLNERKIPFKVLKLEALLRNLPKQSSKRSDIESELSRRKAGYWGETQLDFYLRMLPDDGYFILNDLRLPFKDDYFQIDTLILTRRYCLIIESKNIKGVLFFDGHFDQLIRIEGDMEEAFEDPIVQSKNLILKLSSLLSKQFPGLSFDYLVSIASPKTILKSNTEKVDRVCHANTIVQRIFQLERLYKKEILTFNQVQDICAFLLSLNTPYNKSGTSAFHITRKDLMDGVTCPICNNQLVYIRGKGGCFLCNQSFKDAYLIKLIDYFLLCEPTATNSDLRVFLAIPNRHHTHNFLKGINIPFSGNAKGHVYHMPNNIRELLADPFLFLKTKQKGHVHEIHH